MAKLNYKYHFSCSLFLLISTILIFEFTNLDIILQNNFYNFTKQEWLLDRNNKILKFIFYDGIKKLLIAILLGILFSLLFFKKKQIIKKYQKGLFIILMSGILIPATIGILKKTTNIPCPKNIMLYNGEHPYIKVLQKYPDDFPHNKKIQCWPAGHASGAFALLSLFFLFNNITYKFLSLFIAISLGWLIGGYKILIGDHFISHNIITMLIAWLIILLISKITNKYFKFYATSSK
jgi:membrane-associated PAP2 superfamily phosphatase